MRRGEASVSVRRVTVGGKLDPVMLAVVFGIATAVFLLLTIIVPAVMVANNEEEFCTPSQILRRQEQQICRPPEKNEYTVKVDKNVYKLVKNYRVKSSDLVHTYRRTHDETGTANLGKGHMAFPMTSSYSVSFTISLECEGDGCDQAKVWYLSKANYKKATAKGKFDTTMFTQKVNSLKTPQTYNNQFEGSDMYYVVVANGRKDATVNYHFIVYYDVYDMSTINTKNIPLNDKGEYEHSDVQTDERIIIDYADESGPMLINATVGNEESKSGVIFFVCILFIILTLGCLAVTVVLVLFIFGKLGKFGEKVGKRFQEQDAGQYQPPEVAADTVEITREVVYDD